MSWIGMDIGGTEMKAAIVDDVGCMSYSVKVKTPVNEGRDGLLRALIQEIQELIAHADAEPSITPVQGIGIGSAGRIHQVSGEVLYATDNLPGWQGVNVKEVLKNAFQLPVYVDNDVNCAALGEAGFGAGREVDSFVLLAIGTGVGGAYCFRNEVLSGARGGAAEIGHLILHPGGISCNCGQSGCSEQYISGTALNHRARKLLPEMDSYELLKRYSVKQSDATREVREFLADLALTLISIQNVFDPQRILIGGGLSESYHIYQEELHLLIKEMSPRTIEIIPAKLGNKAGILGSAQLAKTATMLLMRTGIG